MTMRTFVFAVALVVYVYTLAPSVGFIDAGELAAVAHTFGIAHPTGYPLFTMLSGAFSHLPLDVLGSVVYRLNLLSALLSAAAAAGCADLAGRLYARSGFGPSASEAGALTAAGTFAFGRVVWGNALGIEVHSLHALLVVAALGALIRAADEPFALWRWRVLAFVTGLAFSNHLTSVQLLPAFAFVLAGLALPRHGFSNCASLVLPFGLGLLPYLYLPLRAAQDPLVSWGDWTSVAGAWAHVTAHDYRGRFFTGAEAFVDSLRAFLTGLPVELSPLAPLLAVIGMAALARRGRGTGLVLLLLFGASLTVASSYAIPDIGPYFLIAYLVLSLCAGASVALAGTRLPGGAAARVLAAAVVAVPLVGNASVSERGDYLVEDFTLNMFRSLDKDAVVISYQWDHWVAPALYAQAVLGQRPDVVVIDKRLCQRAFYLRALERRHPDLCRPAARELRAAIARAEEGPAAQQQALDAFLQALVDAHARLRPFYVTMDVEEAFPRGYRQVAEGLALRLYPKDALPDLDRPVFDAFVYRPFPRHDHWTDRLRQYYAVMLMGRGTALEAAGRPRAAADYYTRALGFDPSPAVRAQITALIARTRATMLPPP